MGLLKFYFFEHLDDLELIESVPPWYSPKPEYHNTKASTFWDVPVFAASTQVRANRIDVRIIEKEFLVSKETVVLRRWERSKQKFGFIKRVDKG